MTKELLTPMGFSCGLGTGSSSSSSGGGGTGGAAGDGGRSGAAGKQEQSLTLAVAGY